MKYFIFIFLLMISGCATTSVGRDNYLLKRIEFVDSQLSDSNIRISVLEQELEKSKKVSTKDIQFIIDNLPECGRTRRK